MAINEPTCWTRRCKHFIGVKNDGDETTERVVCEAYPNKIPDAIAYGPELHLTPYPGDNGIIFQEKNKIV